MAKSSAQRRREADARKRADGLTRVSVWVPQDSSGEIKRLARDMIKDREIWKRFFEQHPVLETPPSS